MYIYEKYQLVRDIFNAVPIEVAAQIAHCTREEARDLQLHLMQVVRPHT